MTHRIPKIEVYEVSEHELRRLEDGGSSAAQDLAWSTTGISTLVTLVVALAGGTFNPNWRMGLIGAAVCSLIVAVVFGLRWLSSRNTVQDVVDEIRSRRVDPEG